MIHSVYNKCIIKTIQFIEFFVHYMYTCMTSLWQQKHPQHVGEKLYMMKRILLMCICWFIA
jgi:hypothetical protein